MHTGALFLAAAGLLYSQAWMLQPVRSSESLRGVSAVSASVVWASGTHGTYLRTIDGGVTWQVAIVPDAADLDFRGVQALDSHTAWLLSSGPGAKSRIYKTGDGGEHWSLLVTNPDPDGFWDAIVFRNAMHGVVLGDPVGGHFVLMTTADGGRTWQHRKTPPALKDEGAFAASNSCLVLHGPEVWFGAGGPSGARVFHSPDSGLNWVVNSTPLRHDGPGAGIFSLAFRTPREGIAVGGDYGKPADKSGNIAVTNDGGATWKVPAGAPPNGYRSSVAYVGASKTWIAAGTSGSDISIDGVNWKPFDNAAYNAIGVAPGGAVWAVGPGGRVARLTSTTSR